MEDNCIKNTFKKINLFLDGRMNYDIIYIKTSNMLNIDFKKER